MEIFREEGQRVRAREARAVPRRGDHRRLRQRLVGGRAVLLPGRPARVPRPLVLRDMERQLGASGDFAWAYVIAHEIGHHVQRQLGTSAEVDRAQREDPDSANELSVRQELQADCYSGVWARGVFEAGQLEEGDVEEAFRAAEAVGDDRLQQQSGRARERGDVHPRQLRAAPQWFDVGRSYAATRARCDTFAADDV